jgi:hypothetical protein
LSENKDWKVLLIEAGGDPPIESEVKKYLIDSLKIFLFKKEVLQKEVFFFIYKMHAN